MRSGYYKINYGSFNNGHANQGINRYKPRDDMDKRRSYAKLSSTDHHVSACATYKQGMKELGKKNRKRWLKRKCTPKKTSKPEPETAAKDFKINYKAAARDALDRVQQEFATSLTKSQART